MGNGKQEPHLGRKIAELDDRVAEVARGQKRLNDMLNVKDNWHSEVKDWIGKQVVICLREKLIEGRLKWVDRYNIAIVPVDQTDDRPFIVNKGAVQYLCLSESEGRDGQ